VRQDDATRIAFLEQHGFRPGEYAEVNMLRSLKEPVPETTLPTGYQVRPVEESEISDRAAAQREVWQPWTVGDVSDEERFMRLPGYQRDLDIARSPRRRHRRQWDDRSTGRDFAGAAGIAGSLTRRIVAVAPQAYGMIVRASFLL
jgi:hypothetical protein